MSSDIGRKIENKSKILLIIIKFLISQHRDRNFEKTQSAIIHVA